MFKLSILIPCYNSQDYIRRCIESILSQTYKGIIELVIINDGSTDNTKNIINSYKDKIKNKGYELNYCEKENGGIGSAINLSLKIMTGDFFAWCNSDDFYVKNFAKDVMNVFKKHEDYNILRFDGYFVYENDLTNPYGKFSDGNTDLYKEDLFLNAILEKNFHFGCAVLRTSAFIKVNPKKEIYESREGQNYQLLLPMFYNYKSYYLDKQLFYFVNRKNNLTNQSILAGFDKRLKQRNEHEKILLETLKSMKIKNKRYYINLVKIKYTKVRINLAKEFNKQSIVYKKKILLIIYNIFLSLSMH